MDVKRLKYFTGVAEAGSLSGAAIAMGISQPSLSRQISLLEEELGVKLFLRQRRGVSLTRQGRTLFGKIDGPLAVIDRALRDTRINTGKRQAKLVLFLSPTIATVLVGSLTRRFAVSAPEIVVRIVEGGGGTMGRLIKAGEMDIGIVYGPVSTLHQLDWWHLLPEAHTLSLLEEDMVLIGANSSGLKADTPVSADELAQLPLVLPSGVSLPVILRMLLNEMAVTVQGIGNIRESDSLEQTKEIAISGLGYAIVPLSAIRREVEKGVLKYAPIGDPRLKRELIVVSRKSKAFPEAQAKAIGLLLEEVRELVSTGVWRADLLF